MTTSRGADRQSAQELFDRLAATHLRRDGVTLERVFHNEGLKVNAKLYAFVSKERLVVKVPAATAARLSATAEATPFEPRTGRPMKEWIAVDAPDSLAAVRRWQRLTAEAYRHVSTLPTTRTRTQPR